MTSDHQELPDESQIAEALGEALRSARRASRKTQQELADAAKLDRKTIVRIERGQASPRLDTIWQLADASGTTLSAVVREAERRLGSPSPF